MEENERESFLEKLDELGERGASRATIQLLTEIASDYLLTENIECVVELVEQRIRESPMGKRLPFFYLMDSILKNVGQGYVERFERNIESLFCETFLQIQSDSEMKLSFIKLHKTWVNIFQQKRLENMGRVFDQERMKKEMMQKFLSELKELDEKLLDLKKKPLSSPPPTSAKRALFSPLHWDSVTDPSVKPLDTINLLYDTKSLQCLQCGLRFKDKKLLNNHLDYHFRKNKREKERSNKAFSRQWFLPLSSWNRSSAAALPSEGGIGGVVEKESSFVIAREEQLDCPVCGEVFDQFWEEEEEEWLCKDSVLCQEDDLIYHTNCFKVPEEKRLKRHSDDTLNHFDSKRTKFS